MAQYSCWCLLKMRMMLLVTSDNSDRDDDRDDDRGAKAEGFESESAHSLHDIQPFPGFLYMHWLIVNIRAFASC